MKILFFTLLASPLLFATQGHRPSDNTTHLSPRTIFEFLQREPAQRIRIETNFQALIKKRYSRDYYDGLFILEGENGQEDTLHVAVRTRGNSRLRVCSLPPLKLKFKKEGLNKRGLAGEPNPLKLVMVCRNSTGYEQFVLREYLTYRLYNILTEQSLRSQLIKLSCVDRGGKKMPTERFAFLMEPDEELAGRCAGKIAPNKIVSTRMLNNDECELFSFFQYMIRNTEWYAYTGHNIKLLTRKDSAEVKAIPVGYDFDYSGFVNAPYAVPNDRVPIPDVKERYYQGYCRPKEKSLKTALYFLTKKDQLLALCDTFPHFDKRSRKHTLKYLRAFFDNIENEKMVEKNILVNCGTWMKDIE